MRKIHSDLRIRIAAGLALLSLSSGCSRFVFLPDNWDFRQAESYYEEGNFERALGLYQSLSKRESQAFRRDTILFRLGECYLHLKAPADAQLAYVEIKEQYPAGEYVIDVNNRLATLNAQSEQMNNLIRRRWEQARQRLEEARNQLSARIRTSSGSGSNEAADPVCAPLFITAAEALWDMERYEEARDSYVAAINLQPALRYDAKIRGRLLFPSDDQKGNGGIVGWLTGRGKTSPQLRASDVLPMTPQGILRWPGGIEPIILYNTTLRWERAPQDPRARCAVITGQAKNQAAYRIAHFRIEVALSDRRSQIVDVGYAEISSLDPGAVVAFRVRLGPFDDFENISDYSSRILLSPGEVKNQ